MTRILKRKRLKKLNFKMKTCWGSKKELFCKEGKGKNEEEECCCWSCWCWSTVVVIIILLSELFLLFCSKINCCCWCWSCKSLFLCSSKSKEGDGRKLGGIVGEGVIGDGINWEDWEGICGCCCCKEDVCVGKKDNGIIWEGNWVDLFLKKY